MFGISISVLANEISVLHIENMWCDNEISVLNIEISVLIIKIRVLNIEISVLDIEIGHFCESGSIWYWCADQVIVQRTLSARDVTHAKVGI